MDGQTDDGKIATMMKGQTKVYILTKTISFKLRSLSLHGLLDNGLSCPVQSSLATFDTVRQLNLLQLCIKPVKISANASD